MTATLEREPQAVSTSRQPLAKPVPFAIAAGSLVASAVLFVALGSAGPVRIVLVGLLVFAVVLNLVSRKVEGRRRATDRLVTTIVTSAFVLALLPLISLLYTVIVKGSTRFDGAFFSNTMEGVVGTNLPGGGQHAIVGTAIITVLATLISVPIGLLTAIYLVEYGKGRLARSVTFLVDVMTGIPSIVAGLFAYALFQIIVGPGVRFVSLSPQNYWR